MNTIISFQKGLEEIQNLKVNTDPKEIQFRLNKYLNRHTVLRLNRRSFSKYIITSGMGVITIPELPEEHIVLYKSPQYMLYDLAYNISILDLSSDKTILKDLFNGLGKLYKYGMDSNLNWVSFNPISPKKINSDRLTDHLINVWATLENKLDSYITSKKYDRGVYHVNYLRILQKVKSILPKEDPEELTK